MNGRIKQPIGIKLFTNISIVKLKLGKSRYEIACYSNKVQDWRDKKEKDINEVLQTNTIFKNAVKGDVASKKELKKIFPDMSQEDIVKLILEKGEIQVNDKERETSTSNSRNYIAHIIVEKTYNTETGLPFPQDIIIKVLKEIEFKISENQDLKKQAIKAIKEIIEKKILPIERKMIQLLITFKKKDKYKEEAEFNEFITSFMKFLESIQGNIIEKKIENVDNFSIKLNIKPSYYRDLLTQYDNILSFEILSYEEMGGLTPSTTNKDERLEEIDTGVKEMKISNAVVDKFLEDNYAEENPTKPKKKLHCTKCKGSSFDNQDDLRQHYKTNWHKHNALLSAKGQPSVSAEEFDEYVLMHPESI